MNARSHRLSRPLWGGAVALAAGILLPSGLVTAQTSHNGGERTRKLAEAAEAAPTGLSAEATILDWPAGPKEAFPVLRAGINGWYCLPDYPGDGTNYAPECFDEAWLTFLEAYLSGQEPVLRRIGLSYMLNARWAVSNTDRTATAPSPHNQWHRGGSHLMLAVPDPALLDGFPTTPTPRGGAYVMFAGTPWAHLMIPIPEPHARGTEGLLTTRRSPGR